MRHFPDISQHFPRIYYVTHRETGGLLIRTILRRKTNFLAEAKNHGRRRRSGGLGAVTPPRYVRAHARPRGTPSTPARCPAPRPSPTPHPQHCTRTRTASANAPSCSATSPARGMVRVLNPRCPNRLTNGALHLVPGALAREQLPKDATSCPRVSACVSECFRVHIRPRRSRDLSL
jgi:hypothetical protein